MYIFLKVIDEIDSNYNYIIGSTIIVDN